MDALDAVESEQLLKYKNEIFTKKYPQKEIETFSGNYNESRSIKENIQIILEGNELFSFVALDELTSSMQMNTSFFKNAVTSEFIIGVVKLIENELLFDKVITFLGFLTFYYNDFSDILFNDFLFNYICYVIPKISPNMISKCCSVLANIVYDTDDSREITNSELIKVLLDMPYEIASIEYYRLLATIVKLSNTSSHIASECMKKMSLCIQNPKDPETLNYVLKCFKLFLDGKTSTSASYIICSIIKCLMVILNNIANKEIIANGLDLLSKSFETTNISEYLIEVNFCSTLKKLMNFVDPIILYKTFKTANIYVKNSIFDENEAKIFSDLNFKYYISKCSYKIKIEAINFVSALMFYDSSYIQSIPLNILEEIADLIETDDEYAKMVSYHFFMISFKQSSLYNKIHQEIIKTIHNSDMINIAQNDLMNENKLIANQAQNFIELLKIYNCYNDE